MQFLLGVDKPFGHRIAHEGVALVVELGDFTAIQGEALMLAFVKGSALLAQSLVLLPRVASAMNNSTRRRMSWNWVAGRWPRTAPKFSGALNPQSESLFP